MSGRDRGNAPNKGRAYSRSRSPAHNSKHKQNHSQSDSDTSSSSSSGREGRHTSRERQPVNSKRQRSGNGSAGGWDRERQGTGPGSNSNTETANRREAELLARLEQLETTSAAAQQQAEHDRAKLSFMQDKYDPRNHAARGCRRLKAESQGPEVRSVAERSRNRGSMLVRLIAALRHVDKAKSAVESAQAELQRAEVDLAEASLAATNMMEVEDAQFLPKDASVPEPVPALQAASLSTGPHGPLAFQAPSTTSLDASRATATPFQSTSAAAGQAKANPLGPGFDGPSSRSLPQEAALRQKAGNSSVPAAPVGEGINVEQLRGVPAIRGANSAAAHQPMAPSVGPGWEESTFPSLAPGGDKSKMNLSKFKFKL